MYTYRSNLKTRLLYYEDDGTNIMEDKSGEQS